MCWRSLTKIFLENGFLEVDIGQLEIGDFALITNVHASMVYDIYLPCFTVQSSIENVIVLAIW